MREEYPNLVQGTDEWHAARRGILTSSVIGQLVTPKTRKVASNAESRALVMQLAAERITGQSDPGFVSDDMFRGISSEPIVRALYEKHTGLTVREVGFMRIEEPGWELGYSPDGVIGDDGLIEIKCPRAKEHLRTMVSGEVPPQYMAQCQAALLVSGRGWIDYVSYCAGMTLWIRRAHPNPNWQEALIEAAKACEASISHVLAGYEEASEGLPATEPIVDDIIV